MTTHNLLEVAKGDTVVIKYRPDLVRSVRWQETWERGLRRWGVSVVWVPVVDSSHPILQVFIVVRNVAR